MKNSLTENYIIITDKLKNDKFIEKKIKLKCRNLNINENIDDDIIDNFCNVLKKNKTFIGILDISYNNLNEINLFKVICSVYENKNITGLNIKYNKVTKMIFNKLLLIIENNNLEYLNIQNIELTNQEIKNIIFYTLNKNIKYLKLPYLNQEAFQYLIESLKKNDSLTKLHFFVGINNQNNSNNIHNENIINNYQNTIDNLKNLFKEFLDVIVNKINITNIECKINFQDEELEEMKSFIHSVCEKRKNLKTNKRFNEQELKINSLEIMKSLIPEITGKNKHIEKFEKEEHIIFEENVINVLQKLLP
ncbi:conserved Plasmodium protein, unknown function [Plasmodium gallinaceum]|uniref:Leucine-rich repeat protein n=1 Tax=Plasmodium gallinaceum TaxID=5849 RepID=A0A1J1H0F8_PLAGA|nr:conserved Plasmodium protein, unknown function [Plasmodium gallinaceum]CRG97010.1 conserved Plasmodium protein, unknown function [Plasmodium gallinaceum]